MSALNITETSAKFTDYYNDTRVLLDATQFLQNKSRIPMHAVSDEDGNTIPAFLKSMIQKNRQVLSKGGVFDELLYLTMDTLVISELIKSAAPAKVVELGCTSGKISYNLTEVLGKVNPASQLWLVSNMIGNNSDNQCLDYITQARNIPDLSMQICDYANTNLGAGTFDILVLNGSVRFENYYDTIQEAARIVKENGFIICCTYGDYLLESNFKLIFSEYEEYQFSPFEKIITARNPQVPWSNQSAGKEYALLPELLASLNYQLEVNMLSVENCRKYVKQLEKYLVIASEKYDIQKKLNLIELKEQLFNYVTYKNTEHFGFYRRKLVEIIEHLVTE